MRRSPEDGERLEQAADVRSRLRVPSSLRRRSGSQRGGAGERLGDELLQQHRAPEPPDLVQLLPAERLDQAVHALVVEGAEERKDREAVRLPLQFGGAVQEGGPLPLAVGC